MKKVNYDEMSIEELEQELRELFFYSDKIDDHLSRELELIREALERKRPTAILHTPEEAWESFLADKAEELTPFLSPQAETEAEKSAKKTGPARTSRAAPLLRRVLIAAAVVVLLAGAVLAAGPQLWAWVPRWNAAAGRYEPMAMVATTDGSIPTALAELGIAEPVYPSYLPKGFVLTETHISEEPLILFEQYSRGNQHISITITPIKGFKNIVYQKRGEAFREYQSGMDTHYILSSERNITAIWYTKNYATTISGDISLDDIKRIIDSIYEVSE